MKFLIVKFNRMRRYSARLCVVAILSLTLTGEETFLAQTVPLSPASSPKPAPPANNAPPAAVKLARTEAAPKIDGVMNENEWAGATTIELARQTEPQDTLPATERTIAYLLYDKEHLYIAFHAFDRNPAAIRAPVSRRDNIAQDDYVSLWLDTFDDRRRAYAFRFNPLGIQEDGIFTDGSLSDLTWDGIIESKGKMTTDGYTVEAQIPFKTLRFQINDKKTWGLHLFRWIAHKQERTSWQPILRDKPSTLLQMGELAELDGIFGGRTLDLIPTVTLSANGTREADSTIPTGARLRNENKFDPGLTMTYTLTPNLTLSATVNPDFSQIEADVPQVNVNQRFPLFFPERRPFFLEGAEVFRGTYSAAPRLIDTRQIVDPDWGIKLTGKIGKNTIGILSASDNAPGLRVAPTDPNYNKNALFNIVRYQRDVFRQSNIGGSFTDRRFANGSNTVGTLDGRIRVGEKQLFTYQVSYSKTKELNGTKREGAGAYFAYTYNDRKWDYGFTDSHYARNFRTQVGFLRRTGYDRQYGYIGRSFRPQEKSWWVKIRPFVVALAFRNEQGNLDESFLDPGLDMEFARGITAYVYYSKRRDNFAGRGFSTTAYNGIFSFNTFRWISVNATLEFGEGVNFNPARAEIGDLFDSSLNVTLRPTAKLNTEFLWLKSSLGSRGGAGERLFAQDIYRNRTTYQLGRFHSVRSIVDYDTLERRIGLSLLYAYTPRPNNSIFVGYGDALYNGVDPLDSQRRAGLFRQSRSLFAKFSYNFRF